MSDPGGLLAAAFVAAVATRGLTPDPSLRLLAHAADPSREPVPVLDGPAALGRLHEATIAGPERTARGAWYTPDWLAQHLVATAVDRVGVVADPTCGGGVFLLAAAERLRSLGAAPGAIVDSMLWGADVDPLAVAVAEAALWWWSAEAGEPTTPADRLLVGDGLVDLTVPPAVTVVGNPPFLGQLKSRTTVDEHVRRRLRDRWGDVVRPYTDVAWVFLLAAVDAVEEGGCVAMVQPQSLLAARDATAIRAAVDDLAVLEDCWIGDSATFDAAVDVCAPILRRRDGTVGPRANAWTDALATSRGVPRTRLLDTAGAAGRARLDGPAHPDGPARQAHLRDLATIVAGFRDEYYGLVAAVGEADPTAPPAVGARRLVTVGSIDPLRLLDAPVRFARARWTRPVVDVDVVASGRARRWLAVQHAPKVIVATQTRVVEAVVDETGELVASVPAIAVVPHDPADLWRIAAALHAPSVSAWMLRRTAGTALASDACKPTAAVLADLPLPADRPAWDRAASAARGLVAGDGSWGAFGTLADAAYGVRDPSITDWWLGRLPVR